MRAGFGDVGFVGSDKVTEKQLGGEWMDVAVEPVIDAQCKLVLASAKESTLARRYPVRTIATSYPNTTRSWFMQNDLRCPELLVVNGSVEAYASPNSGFADAIVDVRESGKTLLANGLPYFTPISGRINTLAVCLANR